MQLRAGQKEGDHRIGPTSIIPGDIIKVFRPPVLRRMPCVPQSVGKSVAHICAFLQVLSVSK